MGRELMVAGCWLLVDCWLSIDSGGRGAVRGAWCFRLGVGSNFFPNRDE